MASSNTVDKLPSIIPDGDTDRGVLLGQLVKATQELRRAHAHTAEEVLRIGGVVGATQADVSNVHDEVRGLRADIRDLRAEGRDLRAQDAEITQQVKAIKPKSDPPPKKVNWTGIGKAIGGALVVIGGALGWIL